MCVADIMRKSDDNRIRYIYWLLYHVSEYKHIWRDFLFLQKNLVKAYN